MVCTANGLIKDSEVATITALIDYAEIKTITVTIVIFNEFSDTWMTTEAAWARFRDFDGQGIQSTTARDV